MAIAVQDVQTVGFGSGTSRTITKPTGLAVGDLMLAHMSVAGGGTYSTPSGWTLLTSQAVGSGSGNNTQYFFYKTADSSDVAASNFTFSGGVNTRRAGGLLRIDGNGLTLQSDSGTQSGTGSFTVSTGLTPTRAGSLFILAIFGGEFSTGANSNFSSYALATDDPTWTEQYELDDGVDPFSCALATAIRSQTTATGNATISIDTGNSSNDYVGTLIEVAEQFDNAHSPASLKVNSVIPHRPPSVTLNAVTSDPTVTNFDVTKWVSESKSATTWVNESKS